MESLKKSLVLLLISSFCTVVAQTDAETAELKFNDALLFMGNGEMARGRSLLREAIAIDGTEGCYPYELALSYYVEEDFRAAARILEDRISRNGTAGVEFYLLLGNCRAMQGDTEGAAGAYDDGLKGYPQSGALFLEKGNLQRGGGHLARALTNYESGIEAEPRFAMNYFRAAQACLAMGKDARAMVYAETFINLEHGDPRSATAARLLQDIYGRYVEHGRGAKSGADNGQYYGGKVSFERLVAIDMGGSARKAHRLGLGQLSEIRTRFVRDYYAKGHNTVHREPLFDYLKEVLDAGHMEAYNHWLLSPIDPQEFKLWKSHHPQEWAAFSDWIGLEGTVR